MKKLILLFSMLCFMAKIAAQDVQKLYDERNYIALSHLNIENWESDGFSNSFIKANTFNAMARFEESNKEMEFLLTTNEAKENSYLMIALLTLQADNYVKMFQYKQAAETYKNILNNYGDLLEEAKWSYQNIVRHHSALSNAEPLRVDIPCNTKIQMTQDKKGLPQVLVRTPNDTVSLIFDTGAGMSTVTENIANRLGIKILADSLIGAGITANTEYMKIGIADTLYLGDILYTNVVFGIFKDDKMTFPEHDYIINGTFGFPEMRVLPAIKIHKNGILEVHKSTEQYKSNMMFTNIQQIIIQINDSLLFWLDTGARESSLSVNYYNKNKELIDKTSELTTKTVGGMGSSKEFPIYILKDFPVKINTTTTMLPEMPAFTQSTFVFQSEYDGTLGQNVISQYDYMLLDFKNMYFSLENEKEKTSIN